VVRGRIRTGCAIAHSGFSVGWLLSSTDDKGCRPPRRPHHEPGSRSYRVYPFLGDVKPLFPSGDLKL